MANLDDIREWGSQNGWDVSGERLPAGLRSAYNNRDSTSYQDGLSDADTEGAGERPPVVVKPTPAEKVRQAVERVRRSAPAKKAASRARVSVDKLVGGLWSGLAGIVSNYNPPVSRVLAMQAPVAGMVIEDVVKGTLADRVLQPMARAADGGQTAMALLGPPMIMAAITARPDRAPQLVPLLRVALRSWVSVAGDKLEKIQQEETDFADKYGKQIDEMIEFFMEPMYAHNPIPTVD